MPMLVGLEGTRKPLTCQQVSTMEQALKRIGTRRAVTAAGDRGALNVWRDDQRQLRSEFYRHRITIGKAVHADIASLQVWLMQWWPELGWEV